MDALLSIPVAYRWAITLIFVGLIIGISVTPGVERPDDNLFSWLFANTAPLVQKVLHVATYAVLAILWMWTLQSVESRSLRYSLAFIIAASLGSLLEWQQTRIPGRYGTIADLLLNFVGALLGVLGAFLLI